MSSARAIGRFRAAHKWSSLTCTLFLLSACITGLPLIFREELAKRPERSNQSLSAAAPRLSLDSIVGAARARGAGNFAQFVFWPDDDPNRVGVGVANRLDANDDEVRRLLVDLHTGQVSDEPEEPRALRFLARLHENLFLGVVGNVLLGLTAVAFLVSLVSGVLVYRPFMRRLDFGTIRNTSARTAWLDGHNLIGIGTVVWALVVGATGLVNTLEENLFGMWQAERVPALMAPYAHQAASTSWGSIDTAVATAVSAAGNMKPASIALPGTRFATPRHYFVWMHGTSPVTSRLFTPVLIDAQQSTLTSVEQLPWYLRVLEVCRPFHFGDYGGLFLKVAWASMDLLTIALLGSGAYLWLRGGQPTPKERVA